MVVKTSRYEAMDKRQNFTEKVGSQELRKILNRTILTNVIVFSLYLILLSFTLYQIPENAFDYSVVLKKIGVLSVSFLVVFILANYHIFMKVAEPMDKLMRYFKAVSDDQEVRPLSFRDSDYFKELPSLIIESYSRVIDKEKDLKSKVIKKAS